MAGKPASFEELEASLLNGQKLQGVMTSQEVQEILRARGWEQDFPLFTTVNRIINKQLDPSYVVKYLEGASAQLPDSGSAAAVAASEAEGAKRGPRRGPLITADAL